jgi:hypothetical protein
MSTESAGAAPHARRVRTGWRDWLLVAFCALLVLLLSEALWLWQTWPVRDLLQADPLSLRSAPSR